MQLAFEPSDQINCRANCDALACERPLSRFLGGISAYWHLFQCIVATWKWKTWVEFWGLDLDLDGCAPGAAYVGNRLLRRSFPRKKPAQAPLWHTNTEATDRRSGWWPPVLGARATKVKAATFKLLRPGSELKTRSKINSHKVWPAQTAVNLRQMAKRRWWAATFGPSIVVALGQLSRDITVSSKAVEVPCRFRFSNGCCLFSSCLIFVFYRVFSTL